ncbi:RING finger protein [Rhynchospora pubera]|uniref:RING finger protein n=1 Tax=Rhynchospora pubera TaxID=906938 RepID=A0AAV8CZL5_9POAL|nr:RING finger protein [Rhynchospora pubera]
MESNEASSDRPLPRPILRRSLSSSSVGTSSSVVVGEQQQDRRIAVQKVLQQCMRVLEQLGEETDLSSDSQAQGSSAGTEEEEMEQTGDSSNRSSTDTGYETDEIRDLLKSRVESPEFLEKIGSLYQVNPGNVISQNKLSLSVPTSYLSCINNVLESYLFADEAASWSIINKAEACGDGESDQDEFVVVQQEDIVEGIACFMAAYLLSLKETKELTPSELQKVLSKTFTVKKKKSRLRKAWDGANVIYNVASWSATAIGIYQNPALVEAARTAVFQSWQVLSKLM